MALAALSHFGPSAAQTLAPLLPLKATIFAGLRSGGEWGLDHEQTQAQLEKGHCAVNVHGVKQWTEVYEPFGTVRTESQDVTGAPTNPMKFAGEYLDTTGL